MKPYKTIIFIAVLLFTMLGFVSPVFSMNTGFDIEPLSKTDSNRIVSNIKIELLPAEPAKNPIECFDVNENGMIALGSENLESKIISVYSSDGSFQYAFGFEADGSFGVEWDENSLNIYLVRADAGINIDSQGNVLDAFIIKDTMENNSYWNRVVFSQTRKVNGIYYKIDNDLGLLNLIQSSYSRLVKTTPNGVETVLYDVGNSQLFYSVLRLCIILIVLTAAIIIIAKQFKKNLEIKKRDDRK